MDDYMVRVSEFIAQTQRTLSFALGNNPDKKYRIVSVEGVDSLDIDWDRLFTGEVDELSIPVTVVVRRKD